MISWKLVFQLTFLAVSYALQIRSKRQSHPPTEEGWWDCSMCTYKNPPEFFKCEMCECRKGTSTRKPRVTPQIVAQQVAQSVFTPPPPKKERRERKLERRDRTERQDSTSDYAQDDSVEGDREEPEIPDSQQDSHIPPPAPPIKTKKEIPPSVDSSPPSSVTQTVIAGTTPASLKPKKEPSTSKEKPLEKEKDGQHSSKSQKCHRKRPSRLKNIDRSSGQSMEVTVNNVTVVITDYKPKKEKSNLNTSSSSASSTMTTSDHNRINSLHHTTTQQALHERDGESKDSFSSNHTDTVFSGGEGESINGEVSSTAAES